ncbi:hypothetical protein MLD52_13545 [Puniceicoccaceae bacterium K14]|nr:hypothetical protein [Puniceicoccaceae bacterium K14]
MNDVKVLVINPVTCLPEGEEQVGAEWFLSLFAIFDDAACDFIIADSDNIGGLVGDYHGIVVWDNEESAWEDNWRNDCLLDVIAICQFKKIPFLGVGFGAEILARALDGTQIERSELKEFSHKELLYGVPFGSEEPAQVLLGFVNRLKRVLPEKVN